MSYFSSYARRFPFFQRPGFGVLYFFTFGLCGCGWLIDMFRLPYLVSRHNRCAREDADDTEKNISDAYTLWFPLGLLGNNYTPNFVKEFESFIEVMLGFLK